MDSIYNAEAAEMAARYAGAMPQLSYVPIAGLEMAGIHLGVNSGPIVRHNVQNSRDAAAIFITAKIGVDGNSKSDILSRYRFHIMQIAWQPISYACYAGRTRREGSIRVDFAKPRSNLPVGPFVSDAVADRSFPFCEKSFAFEDVGAGERQRLQSENKGSNSWRAVVETYDHPYSEMPMKINNFAARDSLNYLYEVRKSLLLCTALVVEDLLAGESDMIGCISWQISLWAKIDWRVDNGTPRPHAPRYLDQTFIVDNFKTSAPTDQAEALLLQPPTEPSETYGAKMNAIRTSVSDTFKSSHSNSLYVQAESEWTDSVPPSHFAS